ncbi:MAG TPA: prefoldin subunit alpha [Bacteroidetes bacterium]|nr:prefoldin subunit alpha [Bacteroidota bacterium]
MSKEEELQKYMMVLEQYKEQINQLDMQSQYLQAAVMDYNKAKITLENLSKTDDDSETLIPIGGGAFVYASLKNTSKVLIDIGSDLVAEKNFEGAIKKIEKRIEELQKNQDRVNNLIEQYQAEAADISEKAQEIYNERQK